MLSYLLKQWCIQRWCEVLREKVVSVELIEFFVDIVVSVELIVDTVVDIVVSC